MGILDEDIRGKNRAQAYLALESQDEPFLHGLKFTAMPPTKRFREMELLSGGEKASQSH